MNEIYVEATLTAGYHSNEVIATISPTSSAFIDRSFVLGRQPDTLDSIRSAIRVYEIETRGDQVLVELPGIAIGALRGWVPLRNVVDPNPSSGHLFAGDTRSEPCALCTQFWSAHQNAYSIDRETARGGSFR